MALRRSPVGSVSGWATARAISSRPRILLFERQPAHSTTEILSASHGQAQSHRVVIAHRPSHISTRDRIRVISAGPIVQSEPYAELMVGEGSAPESGRASDLLRDRLCRAKAG